MMRGAWVLMFVAAVLCTVPLPVVAEVRVKDITTLRGLRSNQLIGYGLVMGLQGSGDTLRNTPFTVISLRSMLERLGVNIREEEARTQNIAAVMVTAELPAFASPGQRIDVTVSSLGDAKSLSGGLLVQTPLRAADGQIYAVAQGSVLVSGFDARGQNANLTQGVPTAGRISGGAIVELAAPGTLRGLEAIRFDLLNPDFGTALQIANAIDETIPGIKAVVEGPGTVAVMGARRDRIAHLVASIGDLRVEADASARVIVDERTGTIVIGEDVRVSRVAVAHGNLTVRVTETPNVSQPLPFSEGRTVVTGESEVLAGVEGGHLAIVDGVDLRTLVSGLNQLGLKPHGIIAILQAMKTAGALQAELVVQ